MSETPTPKVIEQPPRDESMGFDLRTEIKDARTGKMLKYQPYQMIVDKLHGQYFIRDGKAYRMNGQEMKDWKPEGKPEVQANVKGAKITPQE